MVKGKILWDNVVRTREGFEDYIKKINGNDYVLDVMQSFKELQSHYFAILHNNPQEIVNKIRSQVVEKSTYNSIAEEEIMGEGENCKIYRISGPQKITIYRRDILDRQNAWERMRDLHSKGPKAISNLIERLESGEFS